MALAGDQSPCSNFGNMQNDCVEENRRRCRLWRVFDDVAQFPKWGLSL